MSNTFADIYGNKYNTNSISGSVYHLESYKDAPSVFWLIFWLLVFWPFAFVWFALCFRENHRVEFRLKSGALREVVVDDENFNILKDRLSDSE